VPQCVARQCADLHTPCLNTMQKSLMEDAATTMVHAYSLWIGWTTVTASSTVWARPMSSLYRTCSTLQQESYCVSASSTTSPLTFEIDCIGCPFSRELNTKCVSWCTSVCFKPHQHISLNCSPMSESANCGHHCSRTMSYGQRRFAVSGPILWNSIPLSVRDPSLTLTQFCVLLKTVLFCRTNGIIAPPR